MTFQTSNPYKVSCPTAPYCSAVSQTTSQASSRTATNSGAYSRAPSSTSANSRSQTFPLMSALRAKLACFQEPAVDCIICCDSFPRAAFLTAFYCPRKIRCAWMLSMLRRLRVPTMRMCAALLHPPCLPGTIRACCWLH